MGWNWIFKTVAVAAKDAREIIPEKNRSSREKHQTHHNLDPVIWERYSPYFEKNIYLLV